MHITGWDIQEKLGLNTKDVVINRKLRAMRQSQFGG